MSASPGSAAAARPTARSASVLAVDEDRSPDLPEDDPPAGGDADESDNSDVARLPADDAEPEDFDV